MINTFNPALLLKIRQAPPRGENGAISTMNFFLPFFSVIVKLRGSTNRVIRLGRPLKNRIPIIRRNYSTYHSIKHDRWGLPLMCITIGLKSGAIFRFRLYIGSKQQERTSRIDIKTQRIHVELKVWIELETKQMGVFSGF